MEKMEMPTIMIIENRRPFLWTTSGMAYRAFCVHELTNKRIHRNLKSLWSVTRKHLCKMNPDCRNLHRKLAIISLCWEKTLDHKVTTQPRPGRTTLISGDSTQSTEHWVFPCRAGITSFIDVPTKPRDECVKERTEKLRWEWKITFGTALYRNVDNPKPLKPSQACSHVLLYLTMPQFS